MAAPRLRLAHYYPSPVGLWVWRGSWDPFNGLLAFIFDLIPSIDRIACIELKQSKLDSNPFISSSQIWFMRC